MSQAATKQSHAQQLEPPRFENGRALLIAGLRSRYTAETMNAIPLQWQRFAPQLGKIAGQIGGTTYGMCWQARDGGGIEYLSGVEVSGFSGLPTEFTVASIPAQRYAVFPTAVTFRRYMRRARSSPSGFQNLATNALAGGVTDRTSLSATRKNSIRKVEWAAWKSGCRSSPKRRLSVLIPFRS